MSKTIFNIIVVNDVENDVRELLHLAIKKHASEWWHEFPDVWIVAGFDGPERWQDRLEILFGLGGSILVMRLPSDVSEREVGFVMRTGRQASQWIGGIYQEDPKSAAALEKSRKSSTKLSGYNDPWGSAPPAGSGLASDDEPPF